MREFIIRFFKYPLLLLSLSLTPPPVGVGLIVGLFFAKKVKKNPKNRVVGIFLSFFASSSSYPVSRKRIILGNVRTCLEK